MKVLGRIWVVEMFNPVSQRYDACAAAALTKEDCMVKLREWRKKNRYDKFRIRPYKPERL